MLYFIGCAVCVGLAVGILEGRVDAGAGAFLVAIAIIFGITGIVSLFV